ncbi:aspartate aminotransferase family protein [Streptomyces clavuligerus]|uniref:Ornithine/acetylornithine aminotransferase n=1 Tax=Streptomyces clavuligerus TaxID=1901 RepID=E2Q751_STRCL|nr:aminotransferase class III-fold pyridoxal phosphate-dependent enzyme [Streptomyces clavuligerus]ANW21535.1 ornithine aminotransferase [Streptomyces clavuligerus]AXU16166.1 aspartate aminotransferase family protein [Streptomyces clavuligerus]EFG05298.1 Ornithine/acetylornithine aminotransferase [Streptomyces clavuligerus]MBY6306314.1 aspartate aminotransferase family protein [Streptomyces clavuligerus]QCS08945.1 aspartate aminotransferase family protein [Streptomyces clavuligerus]
MSPDAARGTARDALTALRRHFSPRLALVYGMNGSGAVEADGRGARVRLSDGRSALDFGSYAVTLLGQRHPAVLDAVRAGLDTMPVSTRVLANPTTARLAEALTEWADPGRLTKVWLGLNGGDAVEAALKLARLATGRTLVLAVEGAYHGKSLGALATTWNPRYRRSLEPLLGGVVHIPADPAAIAGAFAACVFAAVIVEPVQGEGGVRPLDPGFLRTLARTAHEHGAFLVADEIQTGLRRCGPRLLSTDLDLRPDAVLLGKALGGGVQPLSALVATPEFYAPLSADPFVHSSTFSGYPLGAAAALAALAAVEELAPRGERLASALGAGLARLARRHPALITEVRGRGLLWGVEFTGPAVAGDVLTGLGRHGLLVSPCLGRPEVLRLLPPLVADDADVAEALDILDTVCAAVPDAFRHPAMTLP